MVKALNDDDDATLEVDHDPETEPDALLSDMAASRLNVKEQSAIDAQNEGMGDAGEWREFALRRLLRELVAKAGRAEAVEAPANTGKALARRIVLRWLRRALTTCRWWK